MLDLTKLVIQIAVILATCRVVGAIFQKIHQPRVVGEMFAGILLGPSLLGWLAPHASAFLFPVNSLGALNALSQIGLVIFMFLVGLHTHPNELKRQGHAAILTAHVGIAIPLVLAALLARYLYPRLSDDSVTFTSFALFMGAAMSITAFPVLARILTERKMMHTRLGTTAVACAAVGDATGWCILAYIVVLVRAEQTSHSVWFTLLGTVAFIVFMGYIMRPAMRIFDRVYRRDGELSDNMIAALVLMLLASGIFTEWLGIHLLFGAFAAGTVMPKDPRFVRYILGKFESITVVLLLPLFFAHTGLRTSIGALQGGQMWWYCALIIVVATVGKLGGSVLAAWLADIPRNEAVGLGVLMNTRGLMELVILNIGLDLKIISPALFSMMVIMALVTTFMTTPILEWVCPEEMLRSVAEPLAPPSNPPALEVTADSSVA
jgi:Kef-type K+ transport system membrane component KefB